MKILVTGAAGFIGFHTSELLLGRGDEVIGLDNLNDYYDVSLKEARLAKLSGRPGFRFHRLELSDRAGMEALFAQEKPQRVIHLAAQAGVRYSIQNPHAYVDSNLVGFMNILEGCRHHGVEHLVYASSSSVYGANTTMPFSVHHTVDHPLSLYAATKKANELMAHTYSHLYRLPTTGLRFFTVYGPWGRPDNQPAELMHVIDCLEKTIGKTVEKRMLPMQAGDVPATYADVDALTEAVDFKPATPIELGIERFIAWYREYYRIGG